jgi:hypothetical protein
MYVVFLVTGTGCEKRTCCQPEPASPVKFARASSWPLELQRLPMWVPVLALAL